MSEEESATGNGGGARASDKFFRKVREDAATQETAGVDLGATVKKRRGRPPKVRHDADDTPIDGWSSPLTSELKNPDPKMEYAWVSDADRGSMTRPWVPEKWGPTCAFPPFFFGEKRTGEPVRFKGLTLMKWPKAVAEDFRRRDWKRIQHNQAMAYVHKEAQATGGDMSMTSKTVSV